ncbi:uncharacterized protein LOC127420819 [Myxocyprinus asiaticus]|uniref:uncharacterized protein LOC127420819 n=1 Tax=Myxocyprinus asiaticus TaxID=70543 RepID=UPI002221BA0F|nr:uncharacterized protein LOC127420819 [Myxocyprinus asiaticus]
MAPNLLQGQDVTETCPRFPDEIYCHVHDPDKPKEIISQEEADRRRIEEFLKQLLLPKKATMKAKIPEGLLEEDFPPLPLAGSPWVDRPPQHAFLSKNGSYKASLLKPAIQLTGGKPHRIQILNPKNLSRSKPLALTRPTKKIEIKTVQGSIVQLRSFKTGSVLEESNVCREKCMLEGQSSSLASCPHPPVSVQFHTGEVQMTPIDRTFKGGDVELGRSAYGGAHTAQNWAGSTIGSMRNAAGPADNANSHIYHEDATVAKKKATGSGPDMPIPEHMDRIQTWPWQCGMVEWQNKGKCAQQSAPFPQGTGHVQPAPRSPWSITANCSLFNFPVLEKG